MHVSKQLTRGCKGGVDVVGLYLRGCPGLYRAFCFVQVADGMQRARQAGGTNPLLACLACQGQGVRDVGRQVPSMPSRQRRVPGNGQWVSPSEARPPPVQPGMEGPGPGLGVCVLPAWASFDL